MRKRKYIIVSILSVILLSGCSRHKDTAVQHKKTLEKEIVEVTKKPEDKLVDIPISEEEREQLSKETLAVIEPCKDRVNQGLLLSSSGYLPENVQEKTADDIGAQGIAVSLSNNYWNTRNYQNIEKFLKNAKEGTENGAVDLYFISSDGIFNRYHFENKGDIITLTTVDVTWDKEEPVVSYLSRCQLKQWNYTKKGWLVFEQYVPETTDAMNGYEMIRIKPMEEELSKFCSTYLDPIGYQGNNLFLTDWDSQDFKELDFNDLYEYVYFLDNGYQVDPAKMEAGISKDSFEGLMTKYFDISKEKLRKQSSFNGKTYQWIRLGCGNYAPGMSGFPFPEVTKLETNQDGTITATVDAVWDGCGLDKAFTHKVTVRLKDEEVIFLSNHIVKSNKNQIPQYTHRTRG